MQFRDLGAQYLRLKEEIDANIKATIESGRFISGPFVKQLEGELAEYVGVKHCVTCANGTDALELVLRAWGFGVGDAVFVPAFTFMSTAEVVATVDAYPVFVDICEDTFNIDPVSLETPIGEEDDSHLGDFIEDKDAMSPDQYANNELLKDEIDLILSTLTDREEKVIRLRFGLEDGRTRTLEEVGKEFDVTRERIRQIEAKALRKLKNPTKSKRLKEFLEDKK